MREEEFRERLRGALGEPPPSLAAPTVGRPAAASSRVYPRAMGLLAIAVAVLLMIVLVGSRVTLRPRGEVLPAATPTGVAQLAPDSMPCHLAVNMVQEAATPGQPAALASTAGFVNIPAGTFFPDPRATVQDLPAGWDSPSPASFSSELNRWLPVSARNVSPDHRSYVYVKLLPAGATFSDATGSELHLVDGASRSDRTLWAYGAFIEVIEWTSAGILVSTVPSQGGVRLLWLVDPASGVATQAPESADPSLYHGTAVPGARYYSYLGPLGEGTEVYRVGSRDSGTDYSVITLDAAGHVVTIYAGKAGDATDFDPEGTYSDAHGLWLGNFDGSRVWLWKGSTGLRGFTISGGPAAPAGYQYWSITFLPAGPCVPGQFSGVRATPLPHAPTPSPSPSPPYVDWSVLLAKPMILPSVATGASCPVSSQVSLHVNARPDSGKWPNYGFGQGPAYVSGQVMWYSAGTQAMLVLVDPRYTGPVLVRTRRLDGEGSIAITGEGRGLAGGAFGIPQTSSPPYWGTWIGSITPSAPGCYGIQLDGTSFSDYAVIEVKQGPPPAG